MEIFGWGINFLLELKGKYLLESLQWLEAVLEASTGITVKSRLKPAGIDKVGHFWSNEGIIEKERIIQERELKASLLYVSC